MKKMVCIIVLLTILTSLTGCLTFQRFWVDLFGNETHGIFGINGYGSWNEGDRLWQADWLLGVKIMRYWSMIEPQKGQFDFSSIDSQLKLASDHGKKIILEIVTADEARGSYVPKTATPQWLWDMGALHIDMKYKYAENPEGSHPIPVYWDRMYLTYYTKFITELAKRYDGHPALARIEMGTGVYGETVICKALLHGTPGQKEKWKSVGLAEVVWVSYVKEVIDIYTSAFKETELALLITDTGLGAYGSMSNMQKAQLAMRYAGYAADRKVCLQFCGTLPSYVYGNWPKIVLDQFKDKVPVIYEAAQPSYGFGEPCSVGTYSEVILDGIMKTMRDGEASSAIFWCHDIVSAANRPEIGQKMKELAGWMQNNRSKKQYD